MMIQDDAISRLGAYAKSIGVPDGAVGVRSTVQPMVRVKDGATGVDYYGTANTLDVDLEEEVVVPGGADLGYIGKNRMMFADHKYGISDAVGKIRAFIPVLTGDLQTAWKVRFHLTDATEAGRTAKALIDDLGSIGLSVGFIPIDRGPATADERERYGKGGKQPRNIVREWYWFELSPTCLPCNKVCHSETVRRDEKYAAEVERLVTKGRISREGASALGLPIRAERRVHPVARKVFVPDGKGGGVTLVRRA